MIEVKNLVKKYGNHTAVDHLNFTIEEGHVYGFLGPNGAGKSTTMNIMTGYLGATEGEVLINGHDILKEPEEAKKQIGYLPELPPLYMEMTVREYLEFVAELKGIAKNKREESINEVEKMVKIWEVENRLIRNLSKGYRQRVGLAQAVLGYPPIIILDEPTVGLDPKQIIEIRELIRELAKEHTVILSSHILAEIQEVCDYKEIRDSVGGKSYELVLCHYPIFSWKHMSRGTILLYGHTHNSPEDMYFQKCLEGMKDNECRHTGDSPVQAYNVGCMKPWMDYEPRSLQEIIK